MTMTTTAPRRADRPVEPAGRRPAQHQLRRRQHLGQGRRHRPRHRRARRAAVGQGLRRRPRHPHRARAGRAAARPAAALVDVYPGVEREDEMVAAFDYCLHGKGGAAPSIDTAMHGLVDAAHIDHLHPDSGIALATAADGEALTKECFGDRVAWVDWRRPGFQLGLDIAEVKRANPQAIGVVLGGHGITAWGATSQECEANSLEIIRTAEEFLADPRRGRAVRRGRAGVRAAAGGRASGPGCRARAGRARARLHRRAAARSLHRQRRRARLPRPREAPAARGARHLVPRPLPAHEGAAAGRRPAGHGTARGRRRPAARAARVVPRGVRRVLRPARDAGQPARCAGPTRRSCWSPVSACSRSARTSRPPGWPASSTSTRST